MLQTLEEAHVAKPVQATSMVAVVARRGCVLSEAMLQHDLGGVCIAGIDEFDAGDGKQPVGVVAFIYWWGGFGTWTKDPGLSNDYRPV